MEFVKTVRLRTESSGCTSFVAFYRCSPNAYIVCLPPFISDELRTDFRQGYPSLRRLTNLLRSLLSRQGILHLKKMVPSPDRLHPIFLRPSLTLLNSSPPGRKSRVPRTPDEFAREWRESPECVAATKSNANVISLHPSPS